MGVYIQDISLTIPLVVLFLLSMVPVAVKVIGGNEEPRPLMTFIFGIAAIGLTAVAVSLRATNEITLAFENTVVYSPLIKLTTVFLILSALFTALLAYRHPAIPKNQYSEHMFLFLNTLLGMFVLVYSHDLILTFVGIELLSLPLYVLIGIGGNSVIPKESSFKYFVLGSFASAFLLFGTAFIYGATQSTDISTILENGEKSNQLYLTMGVMIFLIGLFFKVALVPFHAWLPDVYQGAPTPITAFMATSVKIVIFVFLLGFVPVIRLVESHAVIYVLQWVAILTMFFGNLIALKQNNFKRMLAYSSISHSGYLFLGIIAAVLGVDDASVHGIMYYLLTYLFMTLGAFAIVCLYEKSEDSELTIDHLKGLAKSNPWLAAALSVLLLSLAGIPPFGGFFAKLFLFSSAIQAEQFWLVVWAVISSVIGVYYYLRPIVYMYMKEKEIQEEFVQNHSAGAIATVVFSVVMIILLGFAAQPFLAKIIHTGV
ncbi:MAG: NADH-quinone oxidoreductase subunit N [Bdellovibrionota bacterium]